MLKRLPHCTSAVLLLGVCSLLPVTPVAGQNFALDFTNNRVEIPYIGTGVSFAEISLEAYVYWRGHTSSEGTSGIMEGRGDTLHWQINANNNVRIRLLDIDQNANAGVQRNEWFHLAVTYNRATRELRMYKNGTVFHTYSGDSGTNNFWTSGDAQFGTSLRSGDRRWNGMIDELRIWNKVRTQGQIQENMNQELLGTEQGLIAYWKLNEGQGTTAWDSSPNKFKGTIVGATWTTNAAPVTPLGFAYGPGPANGTTDVPRDTILSWTRGKDAQKENVYFGTSFADVNNASVTNPLNVLVSQGQTGTTYAPAGFDYGKTYYWRVDDIGAPPDSALFKGRVWSFTVEPYGYPLTKVTATASSSQADMGPEKTVNGSGLNSADQHSTEPKDMWLSAGAQPNWIRYEFDKAYKLHELRVWNSNQLIEPFIGFGAKKVTIETSLDGTTWTPVANVPEFARATGLATYAANTTVSLGGAVAKYVKLTINTNWGGAAPQTGLAEVRFFYAPVEARQPQPATAATAVSVDASLNWRPGREAASHKVYLGTDPNAVANGTVAAKPLTDHSFTPGALNLGTTYYWRVDEVNTVTYPGSVWSFTTQEYAVVEDFESYTDKAGKEIFSAWVDGLADNYKSSGSTVGLDTAKNGTFGETTIIHGGKQAMPFAYDNTKAPNFSEAVLTFATPQNWTINGIKSLSLWFQGMAGNGGQLYVKINNTKVAYNGGAGDLAKTAWIPWNIDLSTVGGNLSKVTTLTIGVEGAGAKGALYLDDVRLYPKAPLYYTPTDPGKADLKALYAFEGNANDTSGNGLNGTLKQAQLVASGRPNGGSAVKVDKVGYVDLGNPPALDFGTGGWTVTAWYKTAMTGTGDANQGTIVAKGGDAAGGHRYALIMSQNTEGVLTLVVDDDVTRYDANSKTKTNDDQWHFVAAQREGTAIRIYIDGQLEGTTTIPAAYNLAGTSQHNAYIGAITDHRDASLYKRFSGLIDDVRVYNRALSVAEILWLAGQTGPVAQPF